MPADNPVSQSNIQQMVQSSYDRLISASRRASSGEWGEVLSLCVDFVVPALGVLSLVILAYFVARFASRVSSAPICKRIDETLGKFVGKLVFNVVMIATLMAVLSYFGVNVTSFAAILGAAGFAVGLAFQGTLSNFAAGILLLVFRPFKVGDMVVIAGITGKVNEIDLFTTTLDTTDNRRIIIPNSSISGNTIENVTHHAHRRVEITVGVAYDCSIDNTREALTKAAESIRPRLIDGPDRGYQVIMSNLGPHSVDWIVRFWGLTTEFHATRESLLSAIKTQLDLAGLRIPYPQLDVHFDALTNPAIFGAGDATRQRPRMRNAA